MHDAPSCLRIVRSSFGIVLLALLTGLGGCGSDDIDTGAANHSAHRSPGNDSGAPGSGSSDSTAPDTALALSGEPPPEVTVEDSFTFEPEVGGAAGANLTFSVENLPPWAEFDPATGRITGTPGRGDEARYGNIRITVDDGQRSTSLPPFAITVVTVGRFSVTLEWEAPDERVDGSALNDLAGYRIYYGRNRNDITRMIELDNPGLSSYVVQTLAAGRWLFQMTAIDASDEESPRSGIASAMAR